MPAAPEPMLNARKLRARQRGIGDAGEVTYTVLMAPVAEPAPQDPGGQERRGSARQRTRLRSGKVIDADGRFLTECLLHDLSASGSRIRHPIGIVVPTHLFLYDDQSGAVHHAVVLWRKGHETGVRFKPPAAASPRSRSLAAQMQKKFYRMAR